MIPLQKAKSKSQERKRKLFLPDPSGNRLASIKRGGGADRSSYLFLGSANNDSKQGPPWNKLLPASAPIRRDRGRSPFCRPEFYLSALGKILVYVTKGKRAAAFFFISPPSISPYGTEYLRAVWPQVYLSIHPPTGCRILHVLFSMRRYECCCRLCAIMKLTNCI